MSLLASHSYSCLRSGLMTLRMLAAQCTAFILRQQVHKHRSLGARTLTQPPDNPVALIDKIHKRSMKAGIAISPDTPSTAITDEVANAADMLLVMTVYPGFNPYFFSLGPLLTMRFRSWWSEIFRQVSPQSS